MVHNTRCRSCGARRTLNKHPGEYVRTPRCSCGGTFRVDWYRMRVEKKVTVCHCNGYHFPHREGSLRCIHYAGDRDLEWESLNDDLHAIEIEGEWV